MKWLRKWWHERVWWHRFTHGKCVECGEYPPMTGGTMCGLCLSKLTARGHMVSRRGR